MRRVLGIDAGGTGTRVLMLDGSQPLFDGRGGRANVAATRSEVIIESLTEATEGCPPPDVVAGCFAGLGGPRTASIASDILAELFPRAELRLASDYVAAVLASPEADVVVVAGTGSIVATQLGDKIVTFGGLGYLLGDQGSAFRYGQALLEHLLLHEPPNLPAYVSDALMSVVGSTERRDVIRCVYEEAAPSELIAKLAPTLTRLADDGVDFATKLVDRHAGHLADDVAAHVTRHLDLPRIRLDLAGGVWRSGAVVEAFSRVLRGRLDDRTLTIRRAARQPVEGALRLGELSPTEICDLVHVTRAGDHR